MRVFELAKELNVTSKDILDFVDVPGKTASSSLTVEMIRNCRAKWAPPPPAKPIVEPPPAPAPEPVAAAPVPPPAPEPPKPAPPAAKKVVIVRGQIIVREFAEQLGLKPNQLITELMMMNVFASINQKIELKVAQKIADKHGFVLEHEKKEIEKKPETIPQVRKQKEPKQDLVEDLKPRPPVVAVMGHVDHGKTSLLDKIRNANVVATEDGGITQHIGAYTVTLPKGHRITFLDTPGHEAFTAMRARGANLTDIVLLVVDGVDGIMPQTREAVQHAKAANVTIMVAINKVDLRAANVERVKQQLQQVGLVPEDWGGEVICCPVSALTGQGIDALLENIAVQSEVLELKANPNRRAQGYVIEAQLQTGMGATATVLVRKGTLRVGDAVVCGPYWGRVKALINSRGEKVKEAGPSDPVIVLGLPEVPEAGVEFVVYPNDRMAKEEAEQRMAKKRAEALSTSGPKRASLEDLLKQAPEPGREKKELALIIKTDVQGSLEAIQHALAGLKSDKVSLNIVLAAIGNITTNDVLLASASNAIIVGFHVAKENEVGGMAKREGVEIRLYSIIYELIDEMRDAMQGLLEPLVRENVHGHAEVKQIFDLSKKGRVAGCLVSDGKVSNKSRARIKRRGDVVYMGHVSTLRRFQNEASEVREGQECGIRLDNFGDYQVGDIIEFYEVEKIAQQL
jgi:translation initiation factor IF-2